MWSGRKISENLFDAKDIVTWASERRIRLPPAQGAFYSQAGILASPSDGAQSLVKGESQGVVGGAGDDSKRNRTKFQVPRPFVSG